MSPSAVRSRGDHRAVNVRMARLTHQQVAFRINAGEQMTCIAARKAG